MYDEYDWNKSRNKYFSKIIIKMYMILQDVFGHVNESYFSSKYILYSIYSMQVKKKDNSLENS